MLFHPPFLYASNPSHHNRWPHLHPELSRVFPRNDKRISRGSGRLLTHMAVSPFFAGDKGRVREIGFVAHSNTSPHGAESPAAWIGSITTYLLKRIKVSIGKINVSNLFIGDGRQCAGRRTAGETTPFPDVQGPQGGHLVMGQSIPNIILSKEPIQELPVCNNKQAGR